MTVPIPTPDRPDEVPPLAEVSIRIGLPFAFDASAGVSIVHRSAAEKDLVCARLVAQWPISPGLRARMSSRLDHPVWEDFARPVSPDLYPHVRRLLGADASASSTASRCLRLSETAWQLLDGELGGLGLGTELRLSKAAVGRLGLEDGAGADEHWLPFSYCRGQGETQRNSKKLSPPILHLFGSGIGLLELEMGPDSEFVRHHGIQGALELVHAVSHLGGNAPAMRWREAAQAGVAETTTLMAILNSLLPVGNGLTIEPLVSGRLFTYVCLRLDGACTAERMRELAYRSAHRHTAHYLPNVEGEGLFVPFENIAHAMSTEGGAVVIVDAPVAGQPVAFFQKFIGNVVKDAYWPMALLAYVEFLKLVRMTGDVCREVNFRQPEASDHRLLEGFRQDILNFRLNYRFSQASQITHHNQYFEAWRAALGSDRLLAELAEDVNEVDGFLDHKLELQRLQLEREQGDAARLRDEERQRRAEINNRRYSYFGIFISALVLLTGLLGSNLKEFSNTSITEPFIWRTVIAVLGVALLVILVRWWQDRRLDGKGK